MLSAEYWNNRYINDDFSWDIGEVSEPLKQYFNQLTDKKIKILLPGAGNAYEAEYLNKHGFENTYILDYAQTAISNFKQRVAHFDDEKIICEDFFAHTNTYDLIIEQTFFCAINPSLRKNYVSKMHSLLKPNGKLVGILFNDTLNANKPPFGGNKTEYENLFLDKFIIKKMESCYNSIKPRANRELFIILNKINY